MSTKKHAIQSNYICYLRFVREFLTYQEDQLFLSPLRLISVTPTMKVSEFLDHHLKPNIQNGLSYIRYSRHFLEKINTIGSIPENAILVTADSLSLNPNITHQTGLKILKEAYQKRDLNPLMYNVQKWSDTFKNLAAFA